MSCRRPSFPRPPIVVVVVPPLLVVPRPRSRRCPRRSHRAPPAPLFVVGVSRSSSPCCRAPSVDVRPVTVVVILVLLGVVVPLLPRPRHSPIVPSLSPRPRCHCPPSPSPCCRSLVVLLVVPPSSSSFLRPHPRHPPTPADLSSSTHNHPASRGSQRWVAGAGSGSSSS